MANYRFPIHDATASGDLAEVQRLVALGGEFQGLNAQGFSPLLLAIFGKHMEIIKYLLEQGASVDERDFRGASPLHIAAFINDLDIVKLLVESGAYIYAEDNSTYMPIHVAAKLGHFKIVKYFREIGMNVNAVTRKKITAFHIAVWSGHIQIADYLLLHGSNVHLNNVHKRYIIKKAVISGKVKAVKYLLETAVGINDEDMYFALTLACNEGHLDIVKILLERDNVMVQSSSYSPVHAAVQSGWIEIVKHFLSLGVDIDFSNNQGYNLLHTASQRPQPLMVQYLLENGADVNRKCLPIGATPLYLAIINGNSNVAELLILNGADLTQAEFQGISILNTALTSDSLFDKDCAKVIIKYSLLMFIPVNIIPDGCYFPTALTEYYNKCQEEITHMKQVLIKNSTVSLHQIICGSFKGNKFVRHLCNDNIKNELDKIEDYLKEFDIYGNIALLIKTNIKKGLQRLRLLNEADLVMKKFTPKLPSEIRWKIFDYLNMTDLTAVIQSDILE